ncbi:dihydrofolate reductase family protein, partial [uncultured Spongiibacter sp.]|uniref:dihydrofolate reductase family protein n=1 Tax=uncultured Spongiibacter sp. TaxID=870896 RepID=UPI002583F6BD
MAAHHRLRQGLEPVAPDPNLNHSGNFLYMLFGEVPDDETNKLLDVDFILHAEHGANASAFGARVAASTLSDLHSAVVTGVGTVLADRPSYTVRPAQWTLADYHGSPGEHNQAGRDWVRQPLRVILDRTLRTPPDVPVVSAPGHCLLVAGEQHPGRQNALESAGAEVMHLPASGSGIDLQQLLIELNRRECNEVLVECGATLAGAFVREGLFDEILVYMAPALLGSSARPLLGLPQLASMSEKVALRWQD